MNLEIADAMATGIPVGPGQVCHCDLCGVCLRPNHRVEVLFVINGADITPASRGALTARKTSCTHRLRDRAGWPVADSRRRSMQTTARS